MDKCFVSWQLKSRRNTNSLPRITVKQFSLLWVKLARLALPCLLQYEIFIYHHSPHHHLIAPTFSNKTRNIPHSIKITALKENNKDWTIKDFSLAQTDYVCNIYCHHRAFRIYVFFNFFLLNTSKTTSLGFGWMCPKWGLLVSHIPTLN